VHIGQRLEGVAGLEQHLQARRRFLVAFEIVARAVGDVVHPVVTTFVQHRKARRDGFAEAAGDRAFDIDGVVFAVADPGVTTEFLLRTRGFELDHAGGRVAAEQRALRTAGHFDLIQIEQREALEDRVLLDHAVVHQRHRLRGVEIEVGIAQAADVEAREGAAERGFDIEARQTARQQSDVVATGGQHFELFAIDSGDRHRHVLDVLGTALRGHGDGIEFRCAWFGGSVLGHGRQSEKNGGGQSADAQRTAAVTMGMSHDMES
jgi:hypothetical protein